MQPTERRNGLTTSVLMLVLVLTSPGSRYPLCSYAFHAHHEGLTASYVNISSSVNIRKSSCTEALKLGSVTELAEVDKVLVSLICRYARG